jgi:hypothetical protein
VKSVRTLSARLVSGQQDGPRTSQPTEHHRWLLNGLLALWPLLVFLSWLQFMMRTPADQGRLLFPALLPVSLALAYGLSQLGGRWSYPIASLLALATSVYCVCFLLPQTYVQPAIIDEASIPAGAERLDHDMGLGLELVASEVGTSSARPGDAVDLTLYWRAQGTTTTAAIVLPEILGRGYTQIGSLPDAYHGGGLYPSTLWPLDGIVRERLQLPLRNEILSPTQGRIFVHLDGQEEFLEVGSIKVAPRAWPRPSETIVARLGDGIALTRASLGTTKASRGATVPVDLQWQISRAPGKDLTTFVHLGDPTQAPLAQADAPALGGDYPSRFWDVGEVFDDRYELQLPTNIPGGRYPVHIGLYDPDTGQRLPLFVEGVRQPYDALLVGSIDVD